MSIDALIAASVGVAEIDAAAKSKRRAKSTSPTQRTLAECRERGWTAQVVERWNPYAKVRVDLFGVIDVIAITPRDGSRHPQLIGIQACAGASHATRRDKILAEERARMFVEASCRLELWSWSQRGASGKRKLWTLRVETYGEMVAGK